MIAKGKGRREQQGKGVIWVVRRRMVLLRLEPTLLAQAFLQPQQCLDHACKAGMTVKKYAELSSMLAIKSSHTSDCVRVNYIVVMMQFHNVVWSKAIKC